MNSIARLALLLSVVFAAPVSAFAAGSCPTDPIDGVVLGSGSGTPAGGIAFDDGCQSIYVTQPGNSSVGIYATSASTTGQYAITVGPNPIGLDLSPGAGVSSGAGTLYVANNGENSVSVVDLSNPSSWGAPPKISLPLTAGEVQKPLYVAVASTGIVLISTDYGNGNLMLFEYNPATKTFKNRTADIPYGISTAILKASADRSTIGAINTYMGESYEYLAATDSFQQTPAPASITANGTVLGNDPTGKLQFSTTTNTITNTASLAVTNLGTTAIIARMPIAKGIPASTANAFTASGDGTLVALITNQGFAVVNVQPSVESHATALSSLYGATFLRVYNDGVTANAVKVTLADPASGASFGTWTSPVIPARAEFQFSMATIEAALNIKPTAYRYSLTFQAPRGFFGTAAYILWNQASGILTNLSTCDRAAPAQMMTDPHQFAGFHSSLLAGSYASEVDITNLDGIDAQPQTPIIDIYDARDGSSLGELTGPPLRGGAEWSYDVDQIEWLNQIHPTPDMLHYVIVLQAPFHGFLQHRMYNQGPGVFTDLTAACLVNSPLPISDPTGLPTGGAQGTVSLGRVFSSLQPNWQSFLRFSNESATAQTVNVSLNIQTEQDTEITRTWTSPTIPAGGELQVSIAQIESGLAPAFTKQSYYDQVTVEMPFAGSVQYVIWNPVAGAITNFSTCDADAPHDLTKLSAVHSSLLSAEYPSYVVIQSNLDASATSALNINDANTGKLLGTYISPPVAGHGNVVVSADQIETALGITPSPGMVHYNITAQTSDLPDGTSGFFLQNLVLNVQTGSLEDMTKVCRPF